MRWGTLSLAALLLGVFASCGGGGGGGPTMPPPPPPPQRSIVFTPINAASPSIALLSNQLSDATQLILDVRAVGVTNLYGVAFDLRYPNGVLRYTGRTEGTFLSADGTMITFQITEAPAGNLVIGLSRLGDSGGASGTGLLFSLQFAPVGTGGGTFTFADASALGPDGSSLSAISWSAGSVQVTL